jgi:hypothetical protein
MSSTMNPIARNVLAVVASLVAGVCVIMLVESVKLMLYPPPPGIDFDDPEQLAEMMRNMPIGALLMVELAYALGSLTAGLVVGKVGATRQIELALGVGGLLTLAGVATLVMAPHPIWFAIVSTLTYVPLAWLGAKLAIRQSKAPAPPR